MLGHKKIIRIVLLTLGTLLLLGLAYGLLKLWPNWHTPLGPSLDLPTQTSAVLAPTTTRTDVVQAAGINTASPEQTESPSIMPTKTPKPHCGGPASMVILAIGSDWRYDSYYGGLADVIRIVRVDFVTPKVTVLSMPRDLWVEIPDIEDHYGITHGKLNQAYLYGTPSRQYYDGPGGGPGLLARTLELNFGLRADHYITVNMETFKDIVDAVGGIDIYLPEPVDGRPIDDKTEDMGYFPAGQHHFNGDQALRFSRIRKIDSGFHRMDRQTQVLCSLREKILTPEVITDLPKIISAFQGSIITDLSPAELSQLVCLAPKVSKENLLFGGLPQEELTPSRAHDPVYDIQTFVYEVDFDIIREIVEQFLNGEYPDKPKEPTCP